MRTQWCAVRRLRCACGAVAATLTCPLIHGVGLLSHSTSRSAHRMSKPALRNAMKNRTCRLPRQSDCDLIAIIPQSDRNQIALRSHSNRNHTSIRKKRDLQHRGQRQCGWESLATECGCCTWPATWPLPSVNRIVIASQSEGSHLRSRSVLARGHCRCGRYLENPHRHECFGVHPKVLPLSGDPAIRVVREDDPG